MELNPANIEELEGTEPSRVGCALLGGRSVPSRPQCGPPHNESRRQAHLSCVRFCHVWLFRDRLTSVAHMHFLAAHEICSCLAPFREWLVCTRILKSDSPSQLLTLSVSLILTGPESCFRVFGSTVECLPSDLLSLVVWNGFPCYA